MVKVSASDFARNFGRFREEAQREAIAITSHGRVSGFFVSAAEYNELKRLEAFARKAYAVEELGETEIAAITASRMAPEHDDLDRLLDDEK